MICVLLICCVHKGTDLSVLCLSIGKRYAGGKNGLFAASHNPVAVLYVTNGIPKCCNGILFENK